MIPKELLDRLNAPTEAQRLAALENALCEANFPAPDARMINNHIHTIYSFSPYSPTAAVVAARAEGLSTAGIVDHDSIAGAREFLAAGRMADLPVTIGIECRVSLAGTPFAEARVNNPDQLGVAYMALHAVPHGQIDRVQAFFAPLREKRNARNIRMVERINALYASRGVALDFARDVLPLSLYENGGTVTERHLMLALARQLYREELAAMPEEERFFAEYDLLAKLKKDALPAVYIDAWDELPTLAQFVSLAKEANGILAYAYLGDVTASVTGDKRPQRFEDERLDELFALLHSFGVPAVTYMPTRNTPEQLCRLRALCKQYGMMQISGEDINSPRQSFRIEKMQDPQFADLIDSTWALIRHENGA